MNRRLWADSCQRRGSFQLGKVACFRFLPSPSPFILFIVLFPLPFLLFSSSSPVSHFLALSPSPPPPISALLALPIPFPLLFHPSSPPFPSFSLSYSTIRHPLPFPLPFLPPVPLYLSPIPSLSLLPIFAHFPFLAALPFQPKGNVTLSASQFLSPRLTIGPLWLLLCGVMT